jgi:hypothetical protein
MRRYFIVLLWLVSLPLHAQGIDSGPKNELNIGLGIGMDYGGIGIRGTFLPVERLGLFASAGYNLNAVGFNAGAQWRFPKRRHAFFLTGMYGYNAVLTVTGDIADKGTYYGITLGAGYQLKAGTNGNFWNWEILVPFRNSNFYDDYDALENIGADPGGFLPVAISIGYHFKIQRQNSR